MTSLCVYCGSNFGASPEFAAKARELGTPGLLVSAPMGGSLAEVLPRRGFAETNRVFFKGFAHD